MKKSSAYTSDKTWQTGNIVIGVILLLPLLILAVRMIAMRMIAVGGKSDTNAAMAVFLLVFFLGMYALPAILLLNGWYRIIRFPYSLRQSHKSCTQPVNAVLSGFKQVNETHGQVDWTFYKAIYTYAWRGVDYQTVSKMRYVGLGKEGEPCTILINPDAPSELYELNNEKKRIQKQRLLGIGMMILGAGFYVPLLITACHQV